MSFLRQGSIIKPRPWHIDIMICPLILMLYLILSSFCSLPIISVSCRLYSIWILMLCFIFYASFMLSDNICDCWHEDYGWLGLKKQQHSNSSLLLNVEDLPCINGGDHSPTLLTESEQWTYISCHTIWTSYWRANFQRSCGVSRCGFWHTCRLAGLSSSTEISYALPPKRFTDPEPLPLDHRYENKEYIKESSCAFLPTLM